MKRHTVTYKSHDIVVVPFPFTDRESSKRRPALVLSDANNFNAQVGHSVLAMITSAANSSWPLDVEISDLDAAGLTSSSVVRMKLFTLDHQLILRKVGALSENDSQQVDVTVRKLLRI
ncbi:MAG: transcriptional regulator [Zetaproteobacteria bacterium CG_4_9_14_3_um_filter_49_83]|nr:MAG: transcriptional regulator [Zetaproteobacteria bacterium CG17_big_fil_post_rev_8_21_14_2_50_50_13]PIV30895.1 MAG: transcriptional regulator [Zetaproteobacteria bacterium CG02_land_8_20_14_3_00_50_9]PIY55391.1 MAG: transcriptional regulator [Zetaproteobacteria bacterium CG_4_10_14_0_8_um_filter_49_80]PJA34962.1 MAG: transcriptional regulator [Zetaproteobacteria bacterium CG_4_9_14_3_um_filter_49_83]